MKQIGTVDSLYFDMECMPGHWIGGDYVSKIVTAVAWGRSKGPITVMTHYHYEPAEMAGELAYAITEADMVIGHYIRGFDLPLLNGELLRNGMPPLGPVLSLDTKQDLLPAHGRSKSQENLAAQLGIKEQKLKVTLREWEDFNTRQPGCEAKGIKRVKDDVIQNRALRRELAKIGWLGTPKVWQPDGQNRVSYVP